jgi:hypothetical protein
MAAHQREARHRGQPRLLVRAQGVAPPPRLGQRVSGGGGACLRRPPPPPLAPASISVLDGMQPTLVQSPPTSPASTSATSRPSPVRPTATVRPALPAPTTMVWTSAGLRVPRWLRRMAPLALPMLAALALALLGACEAPPPGFALVAEPDALTLSAGGPVERLAIRLEPEPGFGGVVELEVTGVPPGVTALLSPATVTAIRAASLELRADATAAAATGATLRVEGRSTRPIASAAVDVVIMVEEASRPEPSNPPNDAFADAAPLEGIAGSVTASNAGASTEPGEPRHAGVDGGRSLWWRWRAPESGPVTFDTYGSAARTALAVYRGGAVDALTPVASDAGGVGDAGGAGHAFVDFEAVAGVTYRIAVDAAGGAEGGVVLNWAAAGAIRWTADPALLDFDATVGDAAPAGQAFELRTDAPDSAPFTVSATEPWIEAAPAVGTLSSAQGGLAIDVTVGACEAATTEQGTVTVVGRGGTLLVPVGRLCAPRPAPMRVLELGGANGRVALDGAPLVLPWTGSVRDGVSVSLEALPFEGYVFERWEGAATGSNNPIRMTITSDSAVTAIFAPAPPSTFALTVTVAGAGTVTSRPPGIDCGEFCEADFDAGITVVLEAEAAPGSEFKGWSGACGGAFECALTMTEALEVVAVFELMPVIDVSPERLDFGELSVGATATAAFTVRNGGGGILRGAASVASPFGIEGASYALAAGESVPVTVRFSPTEAGPVSLEVGFTGGGGATRAVHGEGLMGAVSLSVWLDGSGAGTVVSDPEGIDCGEACTASFPYGTSVTLHAERDPESAFVAWSGCEPVGGSSCTLDLVETRAVSTTFEALHVLAVNRIYVNQSVPSQDTLAQPSGRIPLVANRAGLVRAFVTADRPGAHGAEVVLHYRHGADDPTTVTLMGPGTLQTFTNEGHFDDSFSLLLDPELIRPGLTAFFSVAAISYGESIWARYPDTGYWDIEVATVPTLDLKLVPVTYEGRTPELGDGRVYLEQTQRMFAFPDDGIEIEIGAPYSFGGDLSLPEGWSELLRDMWYLRLSDWRRPHYYGLVDAGRDRYYNGVGFVGHPAAVGDTTMPWSGDTVAHELGHNWGRLHAPCGGPGHLDLDYPYAGGLIGVWGYDLIDRRLQSPHLADLMSYCYPRWVSDYTYRGVMEFRGTVDAAAAEQALADAPAAAPSAVAPVAAAEPLLIVTGQVDAEGIRLDPLFVVEAAPMPFAAGPYRLIAWDAGGTTIVDIAFDTVRVSGSEQPEAILLAVPLGRHQATLLGGVRIEERGVVLVDRRPVLRTFAAQPAQATRLPDGSVRVSWDGRAFAAALIFDGPGGLLLARDASGEAVVRASGDALELLLSDGLRTVLERLEF